VVYQLPAISKNKKQKANKKIKIFFCFLFVPLLSLLLSSLIQYQETEKQK